MKLQPDAVYAFPAGVLRALLSMVAVSGVMLWVLKKNKWL